MDFNFHFYNLLLAFPVNIFNYFHALKVTKTNVKFRITEFELF